MKVAITGHSNGIGKAIADLYPNSLGFSRSNGFDIAKAEDIQLIVESVLAMDCDIFVNNAYHDFAQCDLLEAMFNHWKHDPTKTIVNIISRARYGLGKAKFYGQTKMELYSKAKTMMFSPEKRCRIININPGYVKTDMVSHVPDNVKMLTPEQLAEMIKWCLDQPQGIEIGELSVWCTTLD